MILASMSALMLKRETDFLFVLRCQIRENTWDKAQTSGYFMSSFMSKLRVTISRREQLGTTFLVQLMTQMLTSSFLLHHWCGIAVS